MKTGTIKTLGAAALGVAFAAAAAGSASAAEAPALPITAADPTALVNQLPVQQVSKLLPGLSESTTAVEGVLHGAGGNPLGALPKTGPLDSVTGALGGLGG